MHNAARKYVFALARVTGSGQSPTSRLTVNWTVMVEFYAVAQGHFLGLRRSGEKRRHLLRKARADYPGLFWLRVVRCLLYSSAWSA